MWWSRNASFGHGVDLTARSKKRCMRVDNCVDSLYSTLTPKRISPNQKRSPSLPTRKWEKAKHFEHQKGRRWEQKRNRRMGRERIAEITDFRRFRPILTLLVCGGWRAWHCMMAIAIAINFERRCLLFRRCVAGTLGIHDPVSHEYNIRLSSAFSSIL